MNKTIIDNGGRRLGLERRQYEYTDHIPARRVHEERRSGMDRRLTICIDRRKRSLDISRIKERRTGMERRNCMKRRRNFAVAGYI